MGDGDRFRKQRSTAAWQRHGSRPRDAVTVSVRADGETIGITVRDTGRGIPSYQLDNCSAQDAGQTVADFVRNHCSDPS